MSIVEEFTSQYGKKFKIDILFHGGEPLLWGVEQFQEALKVINNTLKGNFVFLKIQTNLTLFNEEYARLFKKYRVFCSTSIDGPKSIHDALRVDAHGRGTFSLAMDNINLLKKYQRRVGAICVITKLHIIRGAEEIFNFFKEVGIGMNPSPLMRSGRAMSNKYLWISPEEYSTFICKLFDLWLENPCFDIPYFVKVIVSILFRKPPTECRYVGGALNIGSF